MTFLNSQADINNPQTLAVWTKRSPQKSVTRHHFESPLAWIGTTALTG